MSSVLKVGKRLVDQIKPMITSPDGTKTHNVQESQQQFLTAFAPANDLSPCFLQPPGTYGYSNQTGRPASPYQPYLQQSNPAVDYFSPQQQQQQTQPPQQPQQYPNYYSQQHPYQTTGSQWSTSSPLPQNAAQSSPGYAQPSSQSAPPQTYNLGSGIGQPYQSPSPPYAYSNSVVPNGVVIGPTTMASITTPQTQSTMHHCPSPYTPPVTSVSSTQPQRFDMGPLLVEVDSVNKASVTLRPVSEVGFFPPPPAWPSMPEISVKPPRPPQEPPQTAPPVLYQPSSYQAQQQPFIPTTTPIQDNQGVVPLRQTHSAPLVPGISSNFRNIAGPAHSPALSRTFRATQQGESVPSIARMESDSQPPAARKILCLDGGGVRGLASLMILKHLMQRLESLRGGPVEPWEEFDMIAGTSTGGLIALMLGRLRMSVDECIAAYKHLSRIVFAPVHSKGNVVGRAVSKLRAEGKFESEPLEQVVKDMCRERGQSESQLLKDDSARSPKVFLCAAQGANSDAVVIRSYPSGSGEWDDLYDICRIWEAARATSAASTFFDPIEIGHQLYVDGALRYNNPIEKADQESRELWPNECRLIISIGTGSAPGPNVITSNVADLAKTLVKIVTDSEEENARFRRRNRDMVEDNLLYRFNVLHGLADVKLDEWEAIGEISAHAGSYLRSPDTAREFQKCANMMKQFGQRLGLKFGEELQAHQTIQQLSTVFCVFCDECHRGVSYVQKMFFCVDCQMFTCEICHGTHDRDHIRTMLRFDLFQWMPKLPGIQPAASCRYCAKEAKARWECNSCDFALCCTCVWEDDRRVEFFNEHREADPSGRSFVAVYPPYFRTLSEWVADPCPCLNVVGDWNHHCDRCHKVLRIGDRGYCCRSCDIEFGGAQLLCHDCFEQDREHAEKHQFSTFEIVYEESGPENPDDAKKLLLGCAQCPERFENGKELVHKHLHLKFLITPFISEAMRRANYYTCHKKEAIASIQYENPTDWTCAFCTVALAFDQLGSTCLQEGCTDIFCSSCTLEHRTGHRHYMYQFTVWKSEDSEGEIACKYCSESYMISTLQGLWCPDCADHYICLTCILGISSHGSPVVAQGLPHQKGLEQCEVKHGWVFYLNATSS